ncbi:MAG: hypothetical protein NTV34_04625, partial [Proteobacteria bacterium]|nr:hypothetical protein [Pseudomonadota bacterium]
SSLADVKMLEESLNPVNALSLVAVHLEKRLTSRRTNLAGRPMTPGGSVAQSKRRIGTQVTAFVCVSPIHRSEALMFGVLETLLQHNAVRLHLHQIQAVQVPIPRLRKPLALKTIRHRNQAPKKAPVFARGTDPAVVRSLMVRSWLR